MKILGLSAYYHDSAAALIVDGEIKAAAQEERFTRKKHDSSFPARAAAFCLDYAGVTLNELDTVVFYYKPLLKFERLLETYYGFAPRGVVSFFNSMPLWIKEKLFMRRNIRSGLKTLGELKMSETSLLFTEHHISHAASAYYPSGYQESAILTIDGVGEWATASICFGKGAEITMLKELRFPHSVGLLYSSFTYFLGFKVNSGEYKLMGLAPYGNAGSPQTTRFVRLIEQELCKIYDDGSVWLNQDYFSYATGLRMIRIKKWEKLFGMKLRNSNDELSQYHCDLALAIQFVTERIVLLMAREAKRLTGSDNLCMAGGVALNCVANGKLHDARIFNNIFIQPAAGDAGGALGAALAAYHIYYKQPLNNKGATDKMAGAYLGNEISDDEIRALIKRHKAVAEKLPLQIVCRHTAKLISEGNVVGWVQGRMEFGPRALGARSILGDPRNPEMQKKLNLKVKYRESFRPFAPSVLAEDCSRFFELDASSPYMLLVKSVRNEHQNPLPADYPDWSVRDKLYFKRSSLPAVTHIDYSARIQTVHHDTNPVYHQLLTEFKQLTGCPVLVNTSFNVRGEPIVSSAEDAYRCFMRSEIDYLIIGHYVFAKSQQPKWKDLHDWKVEFVLD